MAVEGCGKFLKYTVFFFNFLIFVGGIAILAVGIWTLIDKTAIDFISQILDSQMYASASYILIACGAVVLILGFLGCCGAIKESKCMLGFFFTLLFFIFIILLAGGITAAIFKDSAIKTLKEEMYSTLTKFGSEGDLRTDAWNSVQEQFKCCGVEGDKNSKTSWYFYQQNTTWFSNQTADANRTYVPDSCCTRKDSAYVDRNKCVGIDAIVGAPPRTAPPPTKDNEFLYTNGCYGMIEDFINNNAPIIAGVGIGIALLMLLAMIFSICLCRQIRSEYEA